ncbi:MAG: hypothetical protein KI788_09780 [Mameliella sp.]|nr:hypothetical protein [Mameliella sp.]
MKFRMTVTVEVDDPHVYDLTDEGWPVPGAEPEGALAHEDVAGYVASAVRAWGGQFAPGDALFPRNIKNVRVDWTAGEGGRIETIDEDDE